MATTKNKTTPKKLSTAKSAKNAKNTARPWSWRFSFLTIGIYAIVVTTVVVAALFASTAIMSQYNQTRLARINTIYTSLNLDDSYQVKDANVFGDKRVYLADKGRTLSSKVNYLYGDTVSSTVAKLDEKIKAAGFTVDNEPYSDTTATQYRYSSSNGEYIHLIVSSKVYDDAVTNASILDKDANKISASFDKDTAPSNIIIKVNLDDNNE